MTHIDSIDQVIGFLMVLIRIGAVARALMLIVKMALSEDDRSSNLKKLKGLVVFYVLAEAAHGLLNLFGNYFGA